MMLQHFWTGEHMSFSSSSSHLKRQLTNTRVYFQINLCSGPLLSFSYILFFVCLFVLNDAKD